MEELIRRIQELAEGSEQARMYGPPHFSPAPDPDAVAAKFARPDAREFYTRFDPQDPALPSFWGDMFLFSFASLDKQQAGYAFDGHSGEAVEDWPEGMLVIGECSADPIMLDPAEEGEILYAIHGQGEWDPLPIAANIEGLLKLCVAWMDMEKRRGDRLYDETEDLHDESWALFERLAAEQGIDRQYIDNMLELG